MFDSFKRWTKNEHELCQEDLSAYLDGELKPRQRAVVEKHLKTCAQCRADLESLRHTVALLRMVPTVRLPRSFLLPAAETARQRPVQRQGFGYATLRLATAVATVLLVLVVSGDALLRYALPSPGTAVIWPASEPTMLALEQPAAADETAADTLAAPPPAAAQSESGDRTLGSEAELTPDAEIQPMAAGEQEVESTPASPQRPPALQTKAKPSRPSAVPAAPPSVPTAESAVAPPTASPELLLVTATPLPTTTAVPATPVPEPTAAVASPTRGVVMAATAVAPTAQPVPAVRRQDLLQTVRSVLPTLEVILAVATSALLLATLWMRRGQRSA